MAELPTGTVTFLFTDIEGSTALWEQQPEATGAALTRHDAIIEDAVAREGGVIVRPRGEGDSRFAVFARASDAVAAALAIQQALLAEPWPTSPPLRLRQDAAGIANRRRPGRCLRRRRLAGRARGADRARAGGPHCRRRLAGERNPGPAPPRHPPGGAARQAPAAGAGQLRAPARRLR